MFLVNQLSFNKLCVIMATQYRTRLSNESVEGRTT